MNVQAMETIREVEGELAGLAEALGAPQVREILDLFLEDSVPRLAALGEAIREGDLETARNQAHTLKGSAGNLGAMSLWEACANLEQALRDGDGGAVRRQLGEVEQRLTAVLGHFGHWGHPA